MNPVIRAANTLWRLLSNESISAYDYRFYLSVIHGDHIGSPTQHLSSHVQGPVTYEDLPLLYNQRALLKQWHRSFNQADNIDEADAIEFLLSANNAMQENADSLFVAKFTPGTTRNVRNQPSDMVTHRPHLKKGWSLHLTSAGGGHYNAVRQQLYTKPGDMVLLSPDALYDYRRASDSDLWEHRWVYFPLQERWLELLQWPELGPNIYHFRLDNDDSPCILRLFDELTTTYFNNNAYSQQLSQNLLEQILIRCKTFMPESKTVHLDSRIRKSKEYIANHFNENFSIETLANEIGLSPSRLSSLFKQQTGSSVMNARQEHRMARAAQLLIQSTQSVSRIAEFVGFEDALYFSRSFSQHFECSPRAYRKKMRSSAEKETVKPALQ